MKVLSLLPRSRFTESGMTLPETLSLHFLPPNGSHVLIAAAESAQALLRLMRPMVDFEARQVAVSNLEAVGRYTMFKAENPVFVFSASLA